MCKSDTEPGGPYRCPGDMRSALSRASAAVTDAVNAEHRATNQHARCLDTLMALEEQRDALEDQVTRELDEDPLPAGHPQALYSADGEIYTADDLRNHLANTGRIAAHERTAPLDEVLAAHPEIDASYAGGTAQARHAVEERLANVTAATAAAEAAEGRTRADLDKATAATERAHERARQAQDDYDATTRGVALLRAQRDSAATAGDRAHAERLTARLQAAQARMDGESRQRAANDTRRRGAPVQPAYYRAMGQSDDATRAAHQVALSDGSTLAGCAKTSADGPGRWRHDVTLTRYPKTGNGVEATVPYFSSGPGPHEPSIGEVVAYHARREADYEACDGDFKTWRERHDIPGPQEDPQAYRRAQREFAAIPTQAQKVAAVVGEDCMRAHRRETSAAAVA